MAGLVLALTALQLCFQMAYGQARACPGVCACIGTTQTMDCTPRPEITLTDFRFTTIPQNGPLNTRTIIMSGNLLSSLAPGSFDPYPSLEALVLNDNLFTEVPSEGFDNLPITNLTFDGNPLIELGTAAFSNLTSLQHLSIQRTTTLGSINGSEAFSGLTSLTSLSLDDNLLRSLPGDFLSSTPQLTTLSLRNNSLQTLPEDFLSPVTLSQIQVDLSLNPWSCDCFLRWLRLTLDNFNILSNNMETVCHWPPPHNDPRLRISQVTPTDYQCYAPTISTQPTNVTLLSNITLAVPCGVDAAPFPDVTWIKDGQVLNYTTRVHISRYDATLRFESQGVDDSGDYQCLVANGNGTEESSVGTIVVLESTCFNNAFTISHETDLDCGGEFCAPCNITQRCLLDRDCLGELVCLYAHSLPSFLLYISPSNPEAYTCAEASVPPILLEAILQSELPLDISVANVSTTTDSPTLQSSMHDYLALQLEVSRSTIRNVRLSSVEKTERPLIQVWFELPKTAEGEEAGGRLMELIDSGDLLATVRRKEERNYVSYRLNL